MFSDSLEGVHSKVKKDASGESLVKHSVLLVRCRGRRSASPTEFRANYWISVAKSPPSAGTSAQNLFNHCLSEESQREGNILLIILLVHNNC